MTLTQMMPSANWSDSFQLQMFRWTGAVLFAVALHVGVLAVLLHSNESTDPDIEGSIAIELAPIAGGPPVEMADVAPGPVTPEQAAAVEATKQIPRQEPVKAPTVDPSPLATHPEVSLPAKRPEEKPEPVEKEKAEHAEQESRASVASLATAPPQMEENTSPVPAAPAIGLTAATLQAQANWQKELFTRISRYKRYPLAAHKHRIEGQVTLQFTVDRSGGVVASQVVHSSGSLLLDDEAIAMLRRAAPLPAPPDQAQGSTFEFVLPIRFKIQ